MVQGACTAGSRCRFAHSADELQFRLPKNEKHTEDSTDPGHGIDQSTPNFSLNVPSPRIVVASDQTSNSDHNDIEDGQSNDRNLVPGFDHDPPTRKSDAVIGTDSTQLHGHGIDQSTPNFSSNVPSLRTVAASDQMPDSNHKDIEEGQSNDKNLVPGLDHDSPTRKPDGVTGTDCTQLHDTFDSLVVMASVSGSHPKETSLANELDTASVDCGTSFCDIPHLTSVMMPNTSSNHSQETELQNVGTDTGDSMLALPSLGEVVDLWSTFTSVMIPSVARNNPQETLQAAGSTISGDGMFALPSLEEVVDLWSIPSRAQDIAQELVSPEFDD